MAAEITDKTETAAAEKGSSPGFAWVVLAVTYLFSVAAAMFWFSTTSATDGFISEYLFKLGPENIGANVGLLMTDVAIAALIAALFCFFVQDKIGIKAVMVIGSVFVLGGMLVAALSGSDFGILRISRYIGGLGVGCAATSATTAISIWFGDKNRAFAMAIWGTWVPVAMIINYIVIRPFALADMIPMQTAPNIHLLYWVGAIVAAVAFILMLVVYKNPTQDVSAVHTQRVSLREGLKFITKRRVIALLLCMFFYTFVSNCFTTFNVDFFTTPVEAGGQGMDQGVAGLVAVIASACGILAPLFGIISDKIHPNRKYIMIVIAGVSYTLACVFGFKAWGVPLLVVYLAFSVLAMALIVATVRPAMPLLVKEGGITAVSLGLAAITFLEFFGQIFTTFFGMAKDSFAVMDYSTVAITHQPTIVYGGYAEAGWLIAFPAAIILIICALLTRPGKKDLLPEGK